MSMITNIPEDLNAESLSNYLADDRLRINFSGPHRRNAYRDIGSLTSDDDGVYTLDVCRKGMYDMLPEAMFHPLYRFDNIPDVEYKKRFAEECDKQRHEEKTARKFFGSFDAYMFSIRCLIDTVKQQYADDAVISNMICDNITPQMRDNRFVRQTMPYIPMVRLVRGNRTLLSYMIRKVLMLEGIILQDRDTDNEIVDQLPRYCCDIDDDSILGETFVGNRFDEDIMTFRIRFWSEDECNSRFLDFTNEIDVYQAFLNDFFVGIESQLQFEIVTDTLPVRLSDELVYNYLNYNTNI